MEEDRCLFCNDVIPEGRMICKKCELNSRNQRGLERRRRDKVESENDSTLSKIIFVACFISIVILIFFIGGK